MLAREQTGWSLCRLAVWAWPACPVAKPSLCGEMGSHQDGEPERTSSQPPRQPPSTRAASPVLAFSIVPRILSAGGAGLLFVRGELGGGRSISRLPVWFIFINPRFLLFDSLRDHIRVQLLAWETRKLKIRKERWPVTVLVHALGTEILIPT